VYQPIPEHQQHIENVHHTKMQKQTFSPVLFNQSLKNPISSKKGQRNEKLLLLGY
jgi:hypothetical protein